MAEHSDNPGRGMRWLLGMMAVGMVSIFCMAYWLKPDPRGFGTHQQLGLPPCSFKEICGIPCPHCGMTTSFSNIVRGDFSAAWDANPGGLLLAAILTVLIPWCLAISATGRWVGTSEPFRYLIFGMIGYLVVIFAIWIARIV